MPDKTMDVISHQLVKDLRKDIDELSKTDGNEKIIQQIEEEIAMIKGLKQPELNERYNISGGNPLHLIETPDNRIGIKSEKELCICQQKESPFHGKNTKITFTQSQWFLMNGMLIAEANMIVKKSRGKKQKVFLGISVPYCPWCRRKL